MRNSSAINKTSRFFRRSSMRDKSTFSPESG